MEDVREISQPAVVVILDYIPSEVFPPPPNSSRTIELWTHKVQYRWPLNCLSLSSNRLHTSIHTKVIQWAGGGHNLRVYTINVRLDIRFNGHAGSYILTIVFRTPNKKHRNYLRKGLTQDTYRNVVSQSRYWGNKHANVICLYIHIDLMRICMGLNIDTKHPSTNIHVNSCTAMYYFLIVCSIFFLFPVACSWRCPRILEPLLHCLCCRYFVHNSQWSVGINARIQWVAMNKNNTRACRHI